MVCIDKRFSNVCCIQNCQKQGDALSAFHFKFALEYVISKGGLGLYETQQLLVCADCF
jgi:hypothetical protein